MDALQIFAVVAGSSVIGSIVTLVGTIIIKKMDRKDKRTEHLTAFEKHIQKAVCVMLYDRIKYLGKRYIHEESITAEELNDLQKMHTVFHEDLNGNGFLDALMKHVKELRIVKTKEERT